MIKYDKVIVTNYYTLPYFLPQFKRTVDLDNLEMKDTILALSQSKFLEVGEFEGVPVIVYDTWHEDDHFIVYMSDAHIDGDHIVADGTREEIPVSWDKYLVLH